ncbi:hypothetical protein B0H19DRAFT_1060669 [Mycena capillaripes]|nr:hypothetical protein B0H19DRAFT_1060669 [Mycena capillaripes]
MSRAREHAKSDRGMFSTSPGDKGLDLGDSDSTRSSQRTATVERLGFAGGRVVETRRSEPSLSKKAGSERTTETKRHESRHGDNDRRSGQYDRETTKTRRSEKEDIALEKERLAVEKEILALEVASTELERERVALDRKKLKIDEEHARVTHLIELLKLKRRVWSRIDLQVINEELDKIHASM